MVGVSNATGLREACVAVNGFLSRFPNGTWTDRRALQTPHGHRDIQNMPEHLNHALALGDYRRACGSKTTKGTRPPGWPTKGGRKLRLDMHDKPVSFDARRYHKVETHEGSMGSGCLRAASPCSGDGLPELTIPSLTN